MTQHAEKNSVIADAIFEIFDWSLTKSLVREPACGFKTVGDEDNTIDPYYFGVRFLKLAGFWNRADRFWWNSELNWKADWPDPMQVARCLLDAVRQLRDSSETAQAVIEMLQNILTEMPMV